MAEDQEWKSFEEGIQGLVQRIGTGSSNNTGVKREKEGDRLDAICVAEEAALKGRISS